MTPKDVNNKNLEKILQTYQEAYVDIELKLRTALDFNKNPYFKHITIHSMYRYVELRLSQLERDLKLMIPDSIQTAIAVSYALSLLSRYESKGISHTFEETLSEALSASNNRISLNMANKTVDDISKAIHSTEYTIKALIQKTYSQHLAVKAYENTGRDTLKAQIVKPLTGKKMDENIYSGMTAIVDTKGRRWNTQVYVGMALKTRFHQAHIEGLKMFVEDNDGECDLALIPIIGSIDACRYFEGLVISLTGATEGYRTYDELEASNFIFHPNCRHDPEPYFDEIAIPDDVLVDQAGLNSSVSTLLENI